MSDVFDGRLHPVDALWLGQQEFKAQVGLVDNRPYITVLFGDTPIYALYDTGAMISIIREKELKDAVPNCTIEPSIDAVTASGEPMNIIGEVTLKIRVGGQVISGTFRVSPNLSTPCIFGQDLISKAKIGYCAKSHQFFGPDESLVKIKHSFTIPANEMAMIAVETETMHKTACIMIEGESCQTDYFLPPVLVNNVSEVLVPVYNLLPTDLHLKGGSVVGLSHAIDKDSLNIPAVSEITQPHNIAQPEKEARNLPQQPVKTIADKKKKQFIVDSVVHEATPKTASKLIDLLTKFHQIISTGPYDLGKAKDVELKIQMKEDQPIFVRQFRIPDSHRREIIAHMEELTKLGAVRRDTDSKSINKGWNSPVFAVPKKNGTLRIVVDFRAINLKMIPAYHCGVTIRDCLDQLGRLKPKVLTAIDLRQGFFQVPLHPDSQHITRMTIPGYASFVWCRAPQGLLSSPYVFWSLMERVCQGLVHTIAYLDDLLIASQNDQDHLHHLEQVFDRLLRYGLKINLEKCSFFSSRVEYLGFTITPGEIRPGKLKAKVIEEYQPPDTVKKVMSFLGLCSYFRQHIRNFSMIAGPLCALTSKKSGWRKGALPPAALTSFRRLQRLLTSEPVIRFPAFDRPFHLSVDGCSGDIKKQLGAGLGAVLSQIGPDGKEYVCFYASRSLRDHEKRYSTFLLETAAAVFGMTVFDVYLRGKPFILWSDHMPLVSRTNSLTAQGKKTLSLLSQKQLEYNFVVKYRPGPENIPADFASRNAVDAVAAKVPNKTEFIDVYGYSANELSGLQGTDPWCSAIIKILCKDTTPHHGGDQSVIRDVFRLSAHCLLHNKVLFVNDKDSHQASDTPKLFVPQVLIKEIIRAGHHSQIGGHAGVAATLGRIRSSYFWPTMSNDVITAIKTCEVCQKARHVVKKDPAPIIALPQDQRPFTTVFLDLFGPVFGGTKDYRYVAVATCGFSKLIELILIHDKKAETVANKFFEHWVCRYGVPWYLTSDQGAEFHNALMDKLCFLMGVTRNVSSSRRPQSHGAVESANRLVIRYLRAFTDSTSTDWEEYIPVLALHLNTSIQTAIKTSPFRMCYGQNARLPFFDDQAMRNDIFGEDTPSEIYRKIQKTRKIAEDYNLKFREAYEEYVNEGRSEHDFKEGQEVLLHDPINALRVAGKNANIKFLRPFTGPHVIIKRHDNNNVTIKLAGKRGKRATLRVHVDRIKHFNKEFDNDVGEPRRGKIPDGATASPDSESASQSSEEDSDDDDDASDNAPHGPLSMHLAQSANSPNVLHTPPQSPPPAPSPSTPSLSPAPSAPAKTPTHSSTPQSSSSGATIRPPSSTFTSKVRRSVEKPRKVLEKLVRPKRRQDQPAESAGPPDAVETREPERPFLGRLRYKRDNPNRQAPVVHPTKQESDKAVAYRRPPPPPPPPPEPPIAEPNPEDQPLPEDDDQQEQE